MIKARCKPAVRSAPIEKARLAIAHVAASAVASDRAPSKKRVPDGLAAMGEFGCKHDPFGLLADDGDAGRFAAGVELQPMIVRDGLGCRAVLEDDREWVGAPDRRTPLFQQLSRPRLMAGIER